MEEKPKETPIDAIIHRVVAEQPKIGQTLQECGVKGDPRYAKAAHIDAVDGNGKQAAIASCAFEATPENGFQVKPGYKKVTFKLGF